uniref:Uncharacterized protein n=1 Tax=Tetraselmis sp. GSL018 TaxID=582737 RepID=A0A061QS49_9CHLO
MSEQARLSSVVLFLRTTTGGLPQKEQGSFVRANSIAIYTCFFLAVFGFIAPWKSICSSSSIIGCMFARSKTSKKRLVNTW